MELYHFFRQADPPYSFTMSMSPYSSAYSSSNLLGIVMKLSLLITFAVNAKKPLLVRSGLVRRIENEHLLK